MKSGDLKLSERNVYSQNGEDGVIEEILARLSVKTRLDRWCVEFGAWDGTHLSNTCRLIREEGYNAVLIESDADRVRQLHENFPGDAVVKICRLVTFDGNSTLDRILSETSTPEDFDFLSIDVDGADYHVFESIRRYRPKVTCVEYNPSIPNPVDFVQERNVQTRQGASAKALVRLARAKGYALAHATACNLIFVRDDLISSVIDAPKSIEELITSGNDPMYLFVGYDGSLLSNKTHVKLDWHGMEFPVDRLQPLPKLLRTYPGNYRLGRRLLFLAWQASTNPLQFLRKLKQRIMP